MSGSKGLFNMLGSLRAGAYLFKNYLDASATLSGGLSVSNGDAIFKGNLAVSSRAYLPFRIKKLNLAPYAGAGASLAISSESYVELQLLTGACWFLGPGSLDIGIQYGIKSKFALTIGYNYSPAFKSKH